MAITATTYTCDWPGCEAEATATGQPLPFLWELRCRGESGDMVLCPDHRFITNWELGEALQQRWAEEVFEQEWGFLL
jgi:hypothetical protein